MSWNHRVVKRDYVNPVTKEVSQEFGIHEVYYDEAKHPYTWNKTPAFIQGDTLAELQKNYGIIGVALTKPVLEVENEDGKESLNQV